MIFLDDAPVLKKVQVNSKQMTGKKSNTWVTIRKGKTEELQVNC